MKQIAYHGTYNKEEFDNIIKTGLRQWSFLARHLEDALEYGGIYIVEFEFDKNMFKRGQWQAICHKRISPKHIKSYLVIDRRGCEK